MQRNLGYGYDYGEYFYTGNSTPTYDDDSNTDFDSQLQPVQDVSVDAVLSSLLFNTVVFMFLMAFYECLRCTMPEVYSSRKRTHHTRPGHEDSSNKLNNRLSEDADEDNPPPVPEYVPPVSSLGPQGSPPALNTSMSSLPDETPLDWVGPVFGIPWTKVRKTAGLDGYFFLRYIRMNVRITALSTVWFFAILVPIYATGSGDPNHPAHGWYRFSASNLASDEWRMWVPVVFAYLFSSFIGFVIKQEYRHFLELRQDFLARGTKHVNPQHHYSLMVENIPVELRSNRALQEYFENLFPGRVHSASVVLKLPDLEAASIRCMRSCRRLEKSIAYFNATGKRPTHTTGQARLSVLGVDLEPLDLRRCTQNLDSVVIEDDHLAERPKRGTRVDSISYYTQELASHSRTLFRMQSKKQAIADSGKVTMPADSWYEKYARELSVVATRIMDDSAIDNDLLCPSSDSSEYPRVEYLRAENMTSLYGSFSPTTMANHREIFNSHTISSLDEMDEKGERGTDEDDISASFQFKTPFASNRHRTRLRRWAGKLGLDFLVATAKFLNKQLDSALEGVVGATMSSTGFVTFLDLSSTTCAASALLSAKATVLAATIAPEPREILWQNCHVSSTISVRREQLVNVFLFLGVILWSFPLAAIQAFAKASNLAQIPGMEWILTYQGGSLTRLVNGYLPVVALLGLILILPVLFQLIAVRFERRKTFSDVQASMLSRYFYYQLANIYVSVTAGSILKSLADILDHPSHILQLLGESLPTMVGYFIALLVTKIMAGLPMIFLRFGALFRMLLLKTLSDEPKLTQRELDEVYRQENVQYGWEFPAQLLVVVIVFTYAIICPIILPFGFIYFLGALVVYKKQVLYVYTPVYESGGAMFPMAVQRTLFGLVCGQVTLMGYIVTRACYYQNVALIPLPFMTMYLMSYFHRTYVIPSNRLSLERARAHDRLCALRATHGMSMNTEAAIEFLESEFDKNSYRQPVLTELATEPWTYRRGVDDEETVAVWSKLKQINRFVTQASTENFRIHKDSSHTLL